MYNLNMGQMRAMKTKEEIEKICIANCINLTIHEGKIGFVNPITNKIVLLWDTQYKQKENEEQPMNCVCGNCKYNKRDFSKPQNRSYTGFCCGNEDSHYYGVPTMYNDSCDYFEESEE